MITNSPLYDSMGNKEFWAKTRKEIEREGQDSINNLRGQRADVNRLHSTKSFAKWRIKSMSRSLKGDIDHKRQYTQGLLDVHKERVQEALAEGKPVPLEVLKDYPELARKEEPSKPTWEMTREEFRDVNPFKLPPYEFYKEMGWPEGYIYDRQSSGYRYSTSHLGWVKTAIHKNKKVPDEVLKEYPQLLEDSTIKVLRPEAYAHIQSLQKPELKAKVVVTSEYKGDQLKAIHAYYDDMEDGHLDYKRPVSNRKPRITPRMPKLR